MVDLGVCGLMVSVFLFIAQATIYLSYGFMCYGETHGPEVCLNVADEIAFVLIVFGFIFLIFGTITCGFTLVVWRSTVNEKFSVDNEIKEGWPDLV